MKIAVDLLSLAHGGSETYVREMLPRLAGSGHEFAILLPATKGKELRAALSPLVRQVDLPASLANPFSRHRFQRQELPRWLRDQGIDVLFVPGGLTGTRPGPRDRFKMVVMLRNMLPFEPRQRAAFPVLQYPYDRFRLWLLSCGLIRSFRAADRIIFISRHSMQKVAPLVGAVDPVVIPHGIGAAFLGGEAAGPEALARHGIRRPFVLYVSIFDPYKHQLKVIEGFRRYRASGAAPQGLQLVLAGPVGGAYGRRVQQEAQRLPESVVCTGPLSPMELPPLLRSAEVLLFASTCETCPNIFLEYLGAGRPILSSQTPPMPEFGGEAVRYLPAEDPQAWCDALGEVLGSPQLSEELGERARQRAALYSWEETCRRTLAALTDW